MHLGVASRRFLLRVVGYTRRESIHQLCDFSRFTLAISDYEQGVTVQFNACHTEKQLVAYFVNKDRILPSEVKPSGDLEVPGLAERLRA